MIFLVSTGCIFITKVGLDYLIDGGKGNTGVLEGLYFQDMASPIGEQIL